MTVLLIVLLLVVVFGIFRASRGNGVNKADRARILAGDDILPRPGVCIDRAVILHAPAAVVWPWIAQLGKGRSGWYAPAWIEWFVPASKRGVYNVVQKFQRIKVGAIYPDWGPGSLQVLDYKKNSHVVYGSVKGSEATPQISFLFSWALIVIPINETKCRLYIRLRFRRSKHPILAKVGYVMGGFFDYLTIIILFAGLKRRLKMVNT